jgi:triosephosphate isomerase
MANAERRLVIAGNWKMNKTVAESLAFARELRGLVSVVRDRVEIVVVPPFTAIHAVAKAVEDSNILVGAQNCHWDASGALTGEVSAQMVKEAGATYVVLGHSERRQLFGETDETVNKRVRAALAVGLKAILCVGETLREREAGQTLAVVGRQLEGGLTGLEAGEMDNVIIAYEPVWAIGTGKTATSQQAQDVHAFIRDVLVKRVGKVVADTVRIQYGGSVKPDNASELLGQQDVDGALVGGASLKASDFAAIVKARA